MANDPAPSGPTFKDSSKPDTSNGGLGLEHLNFLDGLLFALTGTPRNAQTPADQEKHARMEKKAGDSAASFANSGGDAADAFMGAPGSSGQGINLADVVKFIGMVA